jgi:L-seryl-tRNA(Ser) seleniumtransferase
MHDRVKSGPRRKIPAVSKILDALGRCDLPRPVVVDLVRRRLSQIRAGIDVPGFESIVSDLHGSLDELRASRLQPIINGTGIVIHTNFGRAPLGSDAVRAKEIGHAIRISNTTFNRHRGRAAIIENTRATLRADAAASCCACALV